MVSNFTLVTLLILKHIIIIIWCRLIERSDDRKQQLHIGRWMFNELREIIMRMDEASTY